MPKAAKRLSDLKPRVRSVTRRREEKQRDSAAERGYDWQWQKLRESKLRTDPLCKRCKDKGTIREAELVHHIRPLSEGGRHRWGNLMSLCRECHEQVHGRKA